jgi:hypothetical protein
MDARAVFMARRGAISLVCSIESAGSLTSRPNSKLLMESVRVTRTASEGSEDDESPSAGVIKSLMCSSLGNCSRSVPVATVRKRGATTLAALAALAPSNTASNCSSV